ncbi:MAG: CCA tRNA nucleotidyltransferase [Candidatus Anstonellaceae archaeon]
MKCAHPNKAQEVFSKVLLKIKPTPKENEKSLKAAYVLIEKLKKVAPSFVRIELAGSLAKGTNLKGRNEFDIFILFPRHYSHHEIALLGLSYARRAFAGMHLESRYAEHPYIQIQTPYYKADVVPAYNIESIEQKGSSVDRSILHTRYVNAHLSLQQKDEVRLLKRFMKNFGIYGAELRVEGFSGYLCELLLIKYGSLLSLMEAASTWSQPTIVFEGSISEEEARKRFSSPLVVVDPVDPRRNVAAVVSQTSLSRFIFECRRFLKAPSERFFFLKKPRKSPSGIVKHIQERGTECLAVIFPAPKTIPDVLWPQLKKTAHAIVRKLQEQDFGVFGFYYWSDGKECDILLELDRWKLPKIKKLQGPSVQFASDVDSFIIKHSKALNIHLEHDKIVAVEKRKETEARRFLLKSISNTAGMGIPVLMEKQLRLAKVLPASLIANRKRLEFLSDYFFAKIA